jgi:hypothetical protein
VQVHQRRKKPRAPWPRCGTADGFERPKTAERRNHGTDRELDRVFRDVLKRRPHHYSCSDYDQQRRQCTGSAADPCVTLQAESSHDQPDLETLKPHALESDKPTCHPVAASDLGARMRKLQCLVMLRFQSCATRYCFSQPAHAEKQQEDSDHELEPPNVRPKLDHSAGRSGHGG